MKRYCISYLATCQIVSITCLNAYAPTQAAAHVHRYLSLDESFLKETGSEPQRGGLFAPSVDLRTCCEYVLVSLQPIPLHHPWACFKKPALNSVLSLRKDLTKQF